MAVAAGTQVIHESFHLLLIEMSETNSSKFVCFLKYG